MNKMHKQNIEIVEYGPYKNGVSYLKVIKCFGSKFKGDLRQYKNRCRNSSFIGSCAF